MSNKKTYTEIFEESCPYYLSMGMSLDEYWNGKPNLVIYYRNAFIIKQRKMNEYMWVNGMYTMKAFGEVMKASFSKEKAKYFDAPLDIYPMTKEQEEQSKKEARERLIKELNQWKANFDSMNNGGEKNG